jgi:hypothetical protein
MSRKTAPGFAVKQAVNLLRRAGFSVIVAQNDQGDWLIHAEAPAALRGERPALTRQPTMRARVDGTKAIE